MNRYLEMMKSEEPPFRFLRESGVKRGPIEIYRGGNYFKAHMCIDGKWRGWRCTNSDKVEIRNSGVHPTELNSFVGFCKAGDFLSFDDEGGYHTLEELEIDISRWFSKHG